MSGPLNSMWNYWQFIVQAYPPKSKFSVAQIPDLSGRTIIVTGGNAGVGYETVKALLTHNAKVYLAARSKDKAEKAIASLKEETGKEATFLSLDLASLTSVKHAAEEFLAKEPALHVLFNNAGVMKTPIEQLTTEGYDLQWGTNVLGHFYFTELLLPALSAGSRDSSDQYSRVITTSTSSSGGYLGSISMDTFADGKARRKVGPQALYFQSKLGNAIVACQAALRYADKGIVSISVNPGDLNTDLYRTYPFIFRKITGLLFHEAPQGALTQLYAGTMPDALKFNGEFMIPWARLGRCNKDAYNEDLGCRVWEWCEKEIKAFENR